MDIEKKTLFVSVGSRFPMDRLISSVDQFVTENVNFSCIAQIGDSDIQCDAITTHKMLNENEFRTYAENAQIHISHAGMGLSLIHI